MTLAVTVTRALVGTGPPDLALEDPPAYSIVRDGAGPGPVGWRREYGESQYMAPVLIGAVKNTITMPLAVRVRALTAASLHSRLAALVLAFEQRTYTLTFTTGGVTYTWVCEPADYSPGPAGAGAFDTLHLNALTQVVTFQVPRQPGGGAF